MLEKRPAVVAETAATRILNMVAQHDERATEEGQPGERPPVNRANDSRGETCSLTNGVRHGLLARDIVLPGEDEGDFERLRCAVHADFSPSGPVEAFLVDRVVNTLWRLRRVEKVETALLYWRVSALRIEQLAAEVRSHERSTLVAGYEMPLLGPQYEITITNGAAHAAAEQRLANARKERDRAVSALGHVIDADLANEEGLSKLS